MQGKWIVLSCLGKRRGFILEIKELKERLEKAQDKLKSLGRYL